jgi:hypothetical protein
MQSVYRIYSENKLRGDILELVSKSLQSFTVHEAIGYYSGRSEPSIILEIIGANEVEVQSLAEKIRAITKQESVLIMKLSGDVQQIGKQSE